MSMGSESSAFLDPAEGSDANACGIEQSNKNGKRIGNVIGHRIAVLIDILLLCRPHQTTNRWAEIKAPKNDNTR